MRLILNSPNYLHSVLPSFSPEKDVNYSLSARHTDHIINSGLLLVVSFFFIQLLHLHIYKPNLYLEI